MRKIINTFCAFTFIASGLASASNYSVKVNNNLPNVYEPTYTPSGNWSELDWSDGTSTKKWADIADASSSYFTFETVKVDTTYGYLLALDTNITASNLIVKSPNNRGTVLRGVDMGGGVYTTLNLASFSLLHQDAVFAQKAAIMLVNLNVTGNVALSGPNSLGALNGNSTGGYGAVVLGSLYSLNIGGNLELTGANSQLAGSRFISFISMQNGVEANIDGLVTTSVTSSSSCKYLGLVENTKVNVGGMNGLIGISNISAVENAVATVVFKNSSSHTASGIINENYKGNSQNDLITGIRYDGSAAQTPLKNGKIALVMDGTGTQIFNGATMNFTGGVQMKSGTLLLNYSDNSSVIHGTLKLAQASSSVKAIFGNSNQTTIGETGSIVGGTFLFSDILLSDNGGTIQIRLDRNFDTNTLIYDSISLSKGISGSGLLTLDLKNFKNQYPDEYLADLVRSDSSKGVKVISWSESPAESVLFDTVDEYKLVDIYGDGSMYRFTTFNGLDGLYISYIAIPEPAALAALFSALALCFAALRRRK